MMMFLEKLPPYDGAPMLCSMDINTDEWPYILRCHNVARGLLPQPIYDLARQEHFNLGGRAVCFEHAKIIEQELGLQKGQNA